MVTRKAVGPPISTAPPAATSSNAPPYPTTPGADSAKTTSSVYSPDLTKSPAFDLIDMREAQQRVTRRDSDVSSHGTWDSDDTEAERETADDFVEVPKPLNIRPSQQNLKDHGADGTREEDLPAILKPGPANGASQTAGQEYDDEAHANPWQLESNNPYLKKQNTGVAAVDNSQAAWRSMQPTQPAHAPPLPPSQAPPAPPVELPTATTPSQELAAMSLNESRPPQPDRKASYKTVEVLRVPNQEQAPLPPVSQLQSVEAQTFPSTNPWRPTQVPESSEDGLVPPPGPPPKAPLSPLEHTTPQYAPPPGPPPARTGDLMDFHEQPAQPSQLPPISTQSSHAPSGTVPETPGARAQRQKSENYQIKHIHWYDASYTADPRMKTALRRSPILTQNANGPCPLLALVNALVLSTPSNIDTPLISTLESRENVSLGLLLDAVFDELTSGRRGDLAFELPDISELYAFLLTLHTGMNVNPQFITPAATPRGSMDGSPPELRNVHPTHKSQNKPGCFQETREMRLYSTFNIPLIHGWTAPKDTAAYKAFVRSAQTFEDAQNIQFAAAELEDKLRTDGLNQQEQQTLEDIQTIKSFLTSWPTQLTDHGLETVSKSLGAGQIAILFRNDHFSTLYKEPKSGAIMTLVTDAGYSSHEEIVWESLVDVSGAMSELFSGDFRSVSHGPELQQASSSAAPAGGDDGWQQVQSRSRYHRNTQPLRVTNGASPASDDIPPPLPGPRPTSASHHEDLNPQTDEQRKASEQEDHDLALALQLQEEEEDQQRQAEQRRRREQELSEQFLSNEERPTVPPRRNTGAAADSAGGPPRNPIPPRTNSRQQRPAVNRPGDAADPDAPPTYEQAASDRPYRPAGSTAPPSQGNPLNAYDALRAAQARSSTSVNTTASSDPRRRSDTNRIRRRSSQMGTIAPGDRWNNAQSPTGGPGQAPAYSSRVQGAAGVRDAEEERCVVM